MELKFLGTSAATPTSKRNHSSFALRLDSGEILVFDSGEDIQRRFEAAKLRMNVPTTIFISHLHGDHVIGLPGLLFNFHLNHRTTPIEIYGPPGLANYLQCQYQTIGLHATNYTLIVNEIYPDIKEESWYSEKAHDSPPLTNSITIIEYRQFLTPYFERKVHHHSDNIIRKNDNYKIKIFLVEHSNLSFGYRFEENDRPGKFDPLRARELGIPESRLWRDLQSGKEITLKDGRKINPIKEKIIGPNRSGNIIAYSGDTTLCPGLKALAQDADYLVCESTYASTEIEKAKEYKHMTATMAAQMANNCNVKKLFLTHFSSRYSNLTVLEEEARLIHPSTRLAEDLLTIEIKLKENNNRKS
ncbi:MAG: ribonuclease Z [Promethearchaeota archaeon]